MFMFPARPRRPMPPFQSRPPGPPFQFGPPPRPPQGPQQNKASLKSQFQTPEGRWDFEKISSTAQQMHGIYNQVSPMITQVGPMVSKFFTR